MNDCRARLGAPVFCASYLLRDFVQGGHGPAGEASIPCKTGILVRRIVVAEPMALPRLATADRCLLLNCGRQLRAPGPAMRRTICDLRESSSATCWRGRREQVACPSHRKGAQTVRRQALSC